MMQVEPTCFFCQGKMNNSGTVENYNYSPHRLMAHLFLCKHCHSEQRFAPTGQLLEYEFRIGDYQLTYHFKSNRFRILYYPNGPFQHNATVLAMQGRPASLTPQTTTLERIKTLILFS